MAPKKNQSKTSMPTAPTPEISQRWRRKRQAV